MVPGFNAAATLSFIDPFRAANYLSGVAHYTWQLFALTADHEKASNGVQLAVRPLSEVGAFEPGIGVVSSSWTPERFYDSEIVMASIRSWGRRGIRICGIDTGAFLLARAGLLTGGKVATHYEHIDSFQEVYPEITCTEELICAHNAILTCAGGTASTDLALHILERDHGAELANACARYVLHDRIRLPGERQNVTNRVPFGQTTPDALREAIRLMEANLEVPLAIPDIADAIGLSQRQLARLFRSHTKCSPVQYYRNIRLDRGRSLITQTEMSILSVAVACGFESAEYFARAYRDRFRTTPRSDRIEGRIPFEYRAWPMHPVPSKK
ncbi:MAG: GlxA family transcriptional regulator [Alphaproteobacteria bacterium]|nr:GlxA family transcriptional regulator [Alphaproteobacteria bacterium]